MVLELCDDSSMAARKAAQHMEKNMGRFVWGKVIERFEYDFDGDVVEVIKYFGTKYVNGHGTKDYEDVPSYHIEEISESSDSLQSIIIAYFAYKNLGLNQRALVAGVCRALEVNPK